MNLIRKAISFLSDVGGAWFTLTIVFGGIYAIADFIIKNPNIAPFRVPIILLFIIIIYLSLKFLWKQIKTKTQEFYIKQEKNKLNRDISQLNVLHSKNNDKLILPSISTLTNMLKVGKRISSEWASDAKEGSFTLYIEKYNHIYDIRGQMNFFSIWKNQELTVFLGKVPSTMKKEAEFNLSMEKTYQPFFYRYKNWDKAVKRAYEKISDVLKGQDKFFLGIYSHYDSDMHFEFEIKIGEILKKYKFDFNGEYLSTNGTKIKIS